MKLTELTALSPLDGRYHSKVTNLQAIFSEYGLIRNRLLVEVEWLKALAAEENIKEVPTFSSAMEQYLDKLLADFSLQDAQQVKDLEASTNHDVKAVEYFLKQ